MTDMSLGEKLERYSSTMIEGALQQILAEDILPTEAAEAVSKAMALCSAVREMLNATSEREERLSKSDTVTLTIQATKDGKLLVRGGAITDAIAILRGQALRVVNRFGQAVVTKQL